MISVFLLVLRSAQCQHVKQPEEQHVEGHVLRGSRDAGDHRMAPTLQGLPVGTGGSSLIWGRTTALFCVFTVQHCHIKPVFPLSSQASAQITTSAPKQHTSSSFAASIPLHCSPF